MANLGFTRQKAGYGGNDEYASDNAPVLTGGVEAPSAPVTPQPQRGFASIGFERETPRASTPTPAIEESDNSNGLAKAVDKSWSMDKDAIGAAFGLGKGLTDAVKPKDYKKKYTEDLPTVEEVNLGRKPGAVYDDEPAKPIPAPFVPQEKKDDYPEEGAKSPFAEDSKAAPAPLSRGVATGLAPDEDVTDAELAEFNRVNAPKEPAKKPVEAENKPEGLFAKKESVPSKAAEPERLTRDKLMKMAGINDDANQRARGLQIESQNRQKDMSKAWNEASRMAASGNILERAEGLQKRAELEREGLSRGLIQQPAGAEAAWKKFQNDPYLVKEFNKAATEREAQMQAEAQAAAQEAARKEAERKAGMEEEKLKLEKDKFAADTEEKKLAREDKLKKDAQDRINQISDKATDFQRQKEMAKIQQDYSKELTNLKFSNMVGEKNKDKIDMNLREAQNAMKQYGAQGLKEALEKAQSNLGLSGLVSFSLNNETVKGEVERALGNARKSYDRFLQNQKDRNKANGLNIPESAYPKWDDELLRDLYDDRKPKTWDQVKAWTSDLVTVGEKAVQYGTPIGRAATIGGNILGGQLRGSGMAQQIPAFGIPQQQQQPFDYSQFLAQ